MGRPRLNSIFQFVASDWVDLAYTFIFQSVSSDWDVLAQILFLVRSYRRGVPALIFFLVRSKGLRRPRLHFYL